MASNPLFIIPDIFPMNSAMATYKPKVLLENAKKNLVFHFWVGRHASFPQKPVVKVSTSDEFEFETAKTVCLL